MKNKQRKGFRNRMSKHTIAILVIVVVLVSAIMVYVISTHQSQPKAVSGTIKTTDTSVNASSNTTNDNTSSDNTSQAASDKSSSGSQSNPNVTLVSPYGSFVSNHQPGQDGSDMKEVSQCITSPGATCYIKFTQNNVVKTLPEKSVDSTGSVLWEWNINDAGLTSGKWTIEAIAKLGDQTKSTTDQLSLEVQ